jgi:hypothetical protein
MNQISKYAGVEHMPLASTHTLVTVFAQANLTNLQRDALRAFADGGTDFTSENIWHAMRPSVTRYHVFQYDGHHYVVDFGREASPHSPPKVYKHKTPPKPMTSDLQSYFLISKWITNSNEISKRYIALRNSFEDWSIAVYINPGSADFEIYSGKTPSSGDVSTLFPIEVNLATGNAPTPLPATVGGAAGNTPTPTPLPATVVRQTTGDASQTILQPPNGSENSAKQQTPPDKVVTPNTPTPLPQNQNQMAQPSPTTLATTPCTGPYEIAINKYNADVQKAPIMGKPIACSTAATEAKTKLTVTITPSVPIALGSVTFKDVPMEKKDDVWVGFMMIAPTAASSSQWIQLEVKEQKLSYTACLGQCDTTSPKYEQKKDLEVKHDKDKKYKFEGGTVEYTEEDPFHKGMSQSLKLGLIIGIPAAVVFIALVIAVLVFTNRGSSAVTIVRENVLGPFRSSRGLNSSVYGDSTG